MSSILITAAGTLAGVVVTGLVAWLIARRTKSGRIDTTEASTLWASAEQIREEQRAEMVALREEAKEMRSETVALRGEAVALRLEGATLRAELVPLRAELVQAHKEAATCKAEIAKLRRRLATVESKVGDKKTPKDELGAQLGIK